MGLPFSSLPLLTYPPRRFPKARVWPPSPSPTNLKHNTAATAYDDAEGVQLPDPAMQEHLLELYFTYVHPSFPVIHKRAFFEGIKYG